LEIAMTMPVRAALYLRVSTGRQADNDLSIPDQRRQAKGYCASRGWEIVADYVEPGLSATDDRWPEFQRMIDAATTKPPAFDVILVHSFSRFFRDQFQLEFYVRRLAKAGVRLVSITQELGDDPMSNMIRQIMALFDEYQSKENAKHTLRAMKENARQGFWNGALPPIGYRIVEASEQRGHRTKKTLEIDPVQAETLRLIFRLAREGSGSSGPMGVKSIATHLNAIGIRTRDGGRWGVDAVHKVLIRTTYIGRHRFNTKFWKTRERKVETEIVEMAVPAIVDKDEFEAVQMLLKSRSPAMVAPRIVSGPTLLTGICFCAACGGAMTLRTGKSGLTATTPVAPKPARARPVVRVAPSPWKNSTIWSRSTSSSVCYSPSVLSSFCHTYSIAALSAPSDESRTSPNCASGRVRQTPNSSGSTMPSRTVSPISLTPC
jgi:site-specific DNA recombinase